MKFDWYDHIIIIRTGCIIEVKRKETYLWWKTEYIENITFQPSDYGCIFFNQQQSIYHIKTKYQITCILKSEK